MDQISTLVDVLSTEPTKAAELLPRLQLTESTVKVPPALMATPIRICASLGTAQDELVKLPAGVGAGIPLEVPYVADI